MKLRRLKIIEFRNVQPGTELEFNDGYNVLLGQNGSGKTTLLRLITSVLRGDFQWLQKEAFALESNLLVGDHQLTFKIEHSRQIKTQSLDVLPSEVRAFVAKDENWQTIVDLRIVTENGETWRVHSDKNNTRVVHADEAEKALLAVDGTPVKFPSLLVLFVALLVSTAEKEAVPEAKRIPLFEILRLLVHHTVSTFRFDESLELFSAITGRCTALGKEEYGLVDGGISQSAESEGGFLLPREVRHSNAVKNPNFDAPADTIVLKHDQAPFLAKIAQLLGYTGAEIKLDLLGKEVTEKEKKLEYGNLRFFFHGRDGSIVNQDHLSYGQKRLLTFFYYLACNPHVVVADELVNGLHHAWIAECIREMGDRQVFVTSQNPILLDHLGFTSAEQVRRTFITCQAKPEGVRDRIFWANMSKKNADAFYRAYKVGAQHVGEILRTKGFW